MIIIVFLGEKMKKINFKDKKGITMIVLIVMIIIMTIIIGGATTLVGNQVVSKKIADLEAAMNWYKNEIDSYYLLKSDLPVRDLTTDEKIFVQDLITNYNQDILKLSSKYFMGRDGRNARMQSMNYSDIGNFKIIDEEKLSKRPEWIKDYTKDANVIVNTVTNIPYIASKKTGQNGKSLITINGVGVYTIQNINFEPIDKKMIKN
jgi:hypothetical protein